MALRVSQAVVEVIFDDAQSRISQIVVEVLYNPNVAVSSTASVPAEAAQGLAATRADPVEAAAAIAGTDAAPVDSTAPLGGPVSNTALLPLEAEAGVAVTAATFIEGKQPLSSTTTAPVEVTQRAIAASSAFPEEWLAIVAGSPSTPVFVAVSSVTDSRDVDHLTVSLPSYQAGDIVILDITILKDIGGTIDVSATGWTEKGVAYDGTLDAKFVLWRRMTQADVDAGVSSVTLTASGSFPFYTRWYVRGLSYRGCAPSGDPFDDFQTAINSGTTANSPTVTTTGANRLVVALFGQLATASYTASTTGVTERYDSSDGFVGLGSAAEERSAPTAGSYQVAGSWSSDPSRSPTIAFALLPGTAGRPSVAAPYEALQTSTPVSQTATGPVEWLQRLRKTVTDPLEALAAPTTPVAQTSRVPVEAVQKLVAPIAGDPIDTQVATSAVSRTARFPFEWTSKRKNNKTNPTSATATLPFEARQTTRSAVTATAAAPVEWLQALRKASGTDPVDSTRTTTSPVTTTATGPFEWLQDLHRVSDPGLETVGAGGIAAFLRAPIDSSAPPTRGGTAVYHFRLVF